MLISLEPFYDTSVNDEKKFTSEVIKQIKQSSHFKQAYDLFVNINFQLAVNIITHICARHPLLKKKLHRGIWVLYKFITHNVTEEEIVEQLSVSSYDFLIFQIDDFDAFYDNASKRYFMNQNEGCQYVFHVPWQQALSFVRSRRFIIENGYILLSYKNIVEWMQDFWKYRIGQWERTDNYNVFGLEIPNRAMNARHWAPVVDKFWNKEIYLQQKKERKLFFIDQVKKPLYEEAKYDLYTNDQKLFEEGYQPVLTHWQGLEKQYTEKAEKQDPSTSNKKYQFEAFTPKNGSGLFMLDYAPLLPPCIYDLIVRHFEQRTHLKNDERLLVFGFFYRLKIPLEQVQAMWDVMCSGSGDLTLANYPESIYNWNKEHKTEEKYFYGCARMASQFHLCSFGDIEDLANRQRTCGSSLWHGRLENPTESPSPWPRSFWSPSVAYRSLVGQAKLTKPSSST